MKLIWPMKNLYFFPAVKIKVMLKFSADNESQLADR
jgi:hypothetical protein